MESQITLRLPKALDRALSQRAKARGVPKSQLVREAVARYMSEPEPLSEAEFMERARQFIGSLSLDPTITDPIARQLYEHNFRD